METYVLFVLFVLCHFSNFANGLPTDGGIAKPGYYGIPGTNGLYKYHDTASIWDDAAATCAAEGASLFYAENENEFRTVFTYWKTMRNDFEVHIFMGIRKPEAVFKTVNGTLISNVYHGWRAGEPNNAKGNEDCVEAVITKETDVWGLNDEACNERRTFVCKLTEINEQRSGTTTTDRTTQSNIGKSSGYQNIPGTNGLYKYHDTASVWDDAAATCAAEGARLYYAENDNEFRTVFTYWKTMIKDFPVHIFMGIKKSESVFETLNGTPILNVFHGWRAGEPNNAKGKENCVEAVITTETDEWGLNDEVCDFRRTFICKLKVINEQGRSTTTTEAEINKDAGNDDLPIRYQVRLGDGFFKINDGQDNKDLKKKVDLNNVQGNKL